jgi:hypothetical protein
LGEGQIMLTGICSKTLFGKRKGKPMTKPINTGSISNLPLDLMDRIKAHLLTIPYSERPSLSTFVMYAILEKLAKGEK